MLIDDVIIHLKCPDCEGAVKKYISELVCNQCSRHYKIYEGICIDFISLRKFKRVGKTDIEKRSIDIYNKLFDEKFVWKQNPTPW